jgi:beta-glucanase (GH16 family)
MKHLIKSISLLCFKTVINSCQNQKSNKNIEESPVNNELMKESKESIWKLTWSEEFDEEQLNENLWNRQVVEAGRFNEEWQRYTSEVKNADIVKGSLEITAIHESATHGMNQYTSARLNTAQKKSFKYGKLVARIKLPQGAGLWPAFWMLGTNIDENGGTTPWPDCGEIDVLELYGSKDDAVVEANAHFSNTDGKHTQMGARSFSLDTGIFADDFHQFELEWSTKEMICV